MKFALSPISLAFILRANAEPIPPAGDVVLTLAGGGLGSAPTIYGGNLRGGTAGTAYETGAGTPWSDTTTGAVRRDDGLGEVMLNAGGNAYGQLTVVWPPAQKIGWFIKRKTRAGGLYNGAATPGTWGAASSDKSAWFMHTHVGDGTGFCDFTPSSHTGNGGKGVNGNSVQFTTTQTWNYPQNWDWNGDNNELGYLDLGVDKASATVAVEYNNAVIPAASFSATGDTAADATITTRVMDRVKLNGWGQAGDNLMEQAFILTGDDARIQTLAGNAPHLGLCSNLEFIKPKSWADNAITLDQADIPAGYTHVFIRDRVGNWYSGQIVDSAVTLVAGKGTKPALGPRLPAPSALASGVHITTSGTSRRHMDSAITLTGSWAFYVYLNLTDYTAKKPLIGNIPSTEIDRIQITTAGALEVRVNGISATVTISGAVLAGTKGRLKVAGDGTSLSVSWWPADGSEALVQAVAFTPGRAPQFSALLCSGNQYPAGLKVYAMALEDLVNQNNSAYWRFQPPSTAIASKPVPDLNGGDCHATTGSGSSYLAVGSTPTTAGAFFVD